MPPTVGVGGAAPPQRGGVGRLGVELQLGTPATGLDTGARKVALDGGAFAPAVGERMAAAYAALPCS